MSGKEVQDQTIMKQLPEPTKIGFREDVVNAFYLEKANKSIFVELDCREFPQMEMIYGLIKNKMGIKLRKKIAQMYGDEQTNYKKYIKNIEYVSDIPYIKVSYYQPTFLWGRINAKGYLSGSIFHRPTRHSFFELNYIDCDMICCQIDIVLQLGLKRG